jgi:hypothetical protein
MLENNIAPNTQIGKVDIKSQVHRKENPYMEDKYNRGGDFLDNMTCDYPIEFSSRWFGLAGFEEMLDDIDEYFSTNSIGPLRELSKKNSPILPTTSAVIEPIRFFDDTYKPIYVDVKFPKDLTYEKIVSKSRES